jgi:hypothetical protein
MGPARDAGGLLYVPLIPGGQDAVPESVDHGHTEQVLGGQACVVC